MKNMIEDIQADCKDREEGLLARVTSLLAKDPQLEGMQAQAYNKQHQHHHWHHHNWSDWGDCIFTTNQTTDATGSTPVLQATVSRTQRVITFFPGLTPSPTGKPRLRHRYIHVPELGLYLARGAEDSEYGIMSIYQAGPLFSDVGVRGVTYYKGYGGTNRKWNRRIALVRNTVSICLRSYVPVYDLQMFDSHPIKLPANPQCCDCVRLNGSFTPDLINSHRCQLTRLDHVNHVLSALDNCMR